MFYFYFYFFKYLKKYFVYIFLFFFSCFYSHFGYQHVGIQNVSENARKMRENYPTQVQCETFFLYYTKCWGKTRAGCVFSRVLEA